MGWTDPRDSPFDSGFATRTRLLGGVAKRARDSWPEGNNEIKNSGRDLCRARESILMATDLDEPYPCR